MAQEKPIKTKPNKVMGLYNKLTRLPYGNKIFSVMVARMAPYFSTIKPLITELRPNYCECHIKKGKRVHNHIKTVHVIAICNGLEMAMGVMNKRQKPEMGDAYWDNFYRNLEPQLDAVDREKNQQTSQHPAKEMLSDIRLMDKVRDLMDRLRYNKQWMMVPVAAMAIVIIAFGIKDFLKQPQAQPLVNTAISSIRSISPALANHFDSMRPVMVDYANYSREESVTQVPEDPVMVDKKTLQKLLV